MKAVIFDTQNKIVGIVPDSAIEPARNPFFIPDNSGRWFVSPLSGVRIDRLGKGIAERFADRYFSEAVSAVHPSNGSSDPVEWSRDGALLVGIAAPKTDFADLATSMAPLVAAASLSMTLKTGDLVLRFAGSSRVARTGDTVKIEIQNAPSTTFKIR